MEQTLAVALAGCVAVVGMPHGGLDHLFGRAAIEPLAGRWWRAWFAGLYLGVAGMVVAGWMVAPAVTITVFFLLSSYHFGSADGYRGWTGVALGGVVIWVPLLARPAEVAELLAWVIPGGQPSRVLAAVELIRPVLVVFAVGFAAHVIATGWRGELAEAVRLAVFAALHAVLPVLVGFGLFFCGWHSTREMWGLARQADAAQPIRGLAAVVRLAAPQAAAAVAATTAASWWFAGDRELTPVLVQAVFLGLSSVAVPHIVLHALANRLGADPFARRTEPCPTAATT